VQITYNTKVSVLLDGQVSCQNTFFALM